MPASSSKQKQSTQKKPAAGAKPAQPASGGFMAINWLHLLQRYFVVIIVAEVLVAALIGWWFVVRPAWQERQAQLAAQEEEAEKIEQRVRGYNREINKMEELLATYTTISEEDKDKLARMVPAGVSTESLFAELHDIVTQSGLLVGAITIEDSSEDEATGRSARAATEEEADEGLPDGVASLDVSVNVLALSYNSLQSLLRSLERHVRLLDVQAIAFDPSNSSGEFIIRTYYTPDPDREVQPSATGVTPDSVIPIQ